MSTDFERRLSATLREAADAAGPAYPHLDTGAVISAGRGVVRRRRLLRTGAAVAVLAVVLGAAGIIADGRDQAAEQLPAHQKDIGVVTVTLGHPEPFVDNSGTDIPGPSHFAVTLDTAPDGGQNVAYYAIADGGSRTLLTTASVDLDHPTGTFATFEYWPHVVIGLVPTTWSSLVAVAPNATGGSYSDQAPLRGTRYRAFVSVYESDADTAHVSGLMWLDKNGRVYSDSGAEVPSVALGDSAAYVDAADGIWGMFDTSGSSSLPLNADLGTGLAEQFLDFGSGTGATLTTTFVAIVDVSAENPTVTYARGCTPVGAPVIAPLSDGSQALLLARCTRPESARGGSVTGYGYDVDGTARAMAVAPQCCAVPVAGRILVPAVGSAHAAEDLNATVATDVPPQGGPGQWVDVHRLNQWGFPLGAQLRLAAGQDAVFQLGDGGGFDMAYGLTRSRPTQVTPVGDKPSRFAAGTAFATVQVPGTDLWAVAISLTGTDDSSGHQLTAVRWTDATGRQHTTPAAS